MHGLAQCTCRQTYINYIIIYIYKYRGISNRTRLLASLRSLRSRRSAIILHLNASRELREVHRERRVHDVYALMADIIHPQPKSSREDSKENYRQSTLASGTQVLSHPPCHQLQPGEQTDHYPKLEAPGGSQQVGRSYRGTGHGE